MLWCSGAAPAWFDTPTAADSIHAQTTDELTEAETALAKAKKYNDRVVRETAKLVELCEQSENRHLLEALEGLVDRNKALTEQEAAFKAKCKADRSAMQEEIKELEQRLQAGDAEDKEFEAIEGNHEKVSRRHMRMRAVVAQRNQEIAQLSRLIDEVPTRTELLQYEKRFVELYDTVTQKLDETRKYFEVYNTLEQKHEYLRREESLISSITDQFEASMKSKSSRQAYLEQCEKLIADVRKTVERQQATLDAKRATLDEQKRGYQEQLELQRRYFKAVKAFQEECDKNEGLVQQRDVLAGR